MSCDSLASWRPRTRPTRGAQPRQSKRRGRRSCPSRPSSAAPSPGQGVPRRGFAVSRRFIMKHQAERDDRTTTSTAYLYLYTNSIASAWSVWTPWSATLPGLRSSSSCAPARPPRRALAAMDACGSHGRVRGVRSTSTPPQGKRNVAQSRLAPNRHVLVQYPNRLYMKRDSPLQLGSHGARHPEGAMCSTGWSPAGTQHRCGHEACRYLPPFRSAPTESVEMERP